MILDGPPVSAWQDPFATVNTSGHTLADERPKRQENGPSRFEDSQRLTRTLMLWGFFFSSHLTPMVTAQGPFKTRPSHPILLVNYLHLL